MTKASLFETNVKSRAQFPRAALLRAVLLVLTAHTCSLHVQGQTWRSTLYPEDWGPSVDGTADLTTGKVIQDFSYAGYHRGERLLPVVAGPVFNAATEPYNADSSGTVDSTSAIQAAIVAAQAAGGGVVYLPAGTYRVSRTAPNYALLISGSNVVLRGAGVDRTFILNTQTTMRSAVIIQVEGSTDAAWRNSTPFTPITRDLAGPTNKIPVTDTTPFQVGNWVVVRCDITDAWAAEHKESSWTGNGPLLEGMAYFRRIVAIDSVAKTLTIDIPTRYYLKQRDNARVHLATGPLSEVGLEDFSIANVQHPGATSGFTESDYDDPLKNAYAVHGSGAIGMTRTINCWVRRVETFLPTGNTTTCHILSNGVLLDQVRSVTLEDCHFQRAQYGGGGGNGYMYRLTNSSDNLLLRCRATFCRHGFVFSHMGTSGNVFHGCVDKDTARQTGSVSQSTSGSGSDHHMWFSHSNLVDICSAENSFFDAAYRGSGDLVQHSLTSAHGVYWNPRGDGAGRAAIVKSEQARYGYVIGTRGIRNAVDLGSTTRQSTLPLDHVEGVGLGDLLEPFSLYEDQFIRRLNLPEVIAPAAARMRMPQNSILLQAEVQIGRRPAAPGAYDVQWSLDSGPRAVMFAAPKLASSWVTFDRPGTYKLRVTVNANGRFASTIVDVEVAPPGLPRPLVSAPVADSYVRDGTSADSNFGNETFLEVKNQGGTGLLRRAFLRFDLSALAGLSIDSAILELRPRPGFTVSSSTVMETALVANDQWAESTVTWNNQPAGGSILATSNPDRSDVQLLDVTSAAQQELAGDQLLSVRHRATTQTESTVYSYHSREAGDAQAPRLVLTHSGGVPEFEQWIAGYPSIPAGERGASDDADGDGVSNLEELVYGRDPGRAEFPQAPLRIESMRLHFDQAKNLPPDVFYVLEFSPNLGSVGWQSLPGVVYHQAADLGSAYAMEAQLPAEVAGLPAAFFRLRAERLPSQ